MTTLTTAIKASKFSYVNPNIKKYFSYEKPRSTDYKLFEFDHDIEREEVVKRVEKEGYSVATLSELLAYAKDGWNGEDFVVALGSVAEVVASRRVPFLGGSRADRELHLSWWSYGWLRRCRFLAVRVSVSEPSEPSHSDTLALEKRVAELEAWRELMAKVFNEMSP